MSNSVLHEIISVRATSAPDAPGTMILVVDLTDWKGSRYVCEYCSIPDDPSPVNQAIRQWLTDNEGKYEILPVRTAEGN